MKIARILAHRQIEWEPVPLLPPVLSIAPAALHAIINVADKAAYDNRLVVMIFRYAAALISP